MVEINLSTLRAITPLTNRAKLEALVAPLNAAMAEFDIDTPERCAMFLAQCAHESDHFQTFTEYASGKAYEGRLDLGNDLPGEGVANKGHGLIQTTGDTNHTRVAKYFGIPRNQINAWLTSPVGAARSAGLFWKDNKLNAYADVEDFDKCTKRINGGQNGRANRLELWGRAKKVIYI